MAINILLLCGGDGSEYDISVTSVAFIEENLKATQTSVSKIFE